MIQYYDSHKKTEHSKELSSQKVKNALKTVFAQFEKNSIARTFLRQERFNHMKSCRNPKITIVVSEHSIPGAPGQSKANVVIDVSPNKQKRSPSKNNHDDPDVSLIA